MGFATSQKAKTSITSAPSQVGFGQSFTIDTPNGNDIVEVIIMRPGAVTHSFNMTQRAIELLITVNAAGSVQVVSPPNGHISPPGWHLLFILNAGRVPSEGRWIRLTP